MQNLFSYLLIAFQQPLWLVCLPLAGLPIWLFWLQPVKFRPVPAGWGIKPDYFISRTISLRKWRAILAALSLFSMIMALARPIIPKVAFLEMMPMGHHFAIIIDCSGSMAQIDPAQSNSRLSRLSKAIRHEMQSHPSDRFTIIRVAGYADRIGPPAASPDFLDALLEQMQPASPGEDGTSLADGLILAVDELNRYEPRKAKDASILLVSDGRDNPPDPSSQRLDEIQSLITQNAIPVKWLRLNLPEPEDESPESRKKAQSASQILESITHDTLGLIINIDQESNWPEQARLAFSETLSDDNNQLKSATVFFIIMAALFLSFTAILEVLIFIPNFNSGQFWKAKSAMCYFISLVFILMPLLKSWQYNKLQKMQSQPALSAEKAIGIVLDISPSMASTDTAYGSRLETAKMLSRAMIRQSALRDHEILSIHAFSGRSLQLTPWSSDTSAADLTVRDLNWRQIQTDGSNWHEMLDHLQKSSEKIIYLNGKLQNHLDYFIFTDGEASAFCDDNQIMQLSQSGIKIHMIALGSDAAPGATFQSDLLPNRLWLDRRSGQPAHSIRNDENAKKLAEMTGGKFIPVGISAVDPFQFAQDLIGISNVGKMKPLSEISISLDYLAFALIIALIVELSRSVSLWNPNRLMFLLSIISLTSCSSPENTLTFEDKIILAGQFRDDSQFIRAEALIRSAISENNHNIMLHYHLGLILLDQNLPQQAITEFQKCHMKSNLSDTSSNPVSSRAIYAEGYSKALLGRWKEAMNLLQEALEEPFYRLPQTQPERNEIEKNIDYIQMRISIQNKPDTKSAGPGTEKTIHDPYKFGQMPLRAEIQERAGMVRNRARSVRNIFDKAGDQISGPLPIIGEKGLIDW